MKSKPPTCKGCPLEHLGTGFSTPSGDPYSPLWIVGEALGKDEVGPGLPFQGAAGEMLGRILKLAGLDRDDIFVHNIISCRPPNNILAGAAYETDSIRHCTTNHLWPYINQYKPKAIIATGGTATRHLLGLPKEKFSINNWHGCPTHLNYEDTWVVPTHHPAYLLRPGNQSLIGSSLFDVKRASQIAQTGEWDIEDATLLIDIVPAAFYKWTLGALDDLRTNGGYLSVDIETKDKIGREEDDIPDESYEITRINFAVNGREGVTVVWTPEYFTAIRLLLESLYDKAFWNKRYDTKRLKHHGFKINGKILDFMHAWKMLQSNLPMGLGYVSPFYSRFGAWKHLSHLDPGRYAAIDPVQTIRNAEGITRDLKASGQWEVFLRHMVDLDTYVLEPAEEVGLGIDEVALEAFSLEVNEARRASHEILARAYPDSLRRPFPKGGWKKRPSFPLTIDFKRGKEKVQVVFEEDSLLEDTQEVEVKVCMECGKQGVTKSHTHSDKVGSIKVMQPIYRVAEPFNPSSPIQIAAYADYKKYNLGRDRSTGQITLERLGKKDPFFLEVLKYREVDKIKGTYVDATKRRIELYPDRRIHTQFKRKPSTLRLSSVNPNITNIVSPRASKLANGFRNTIVAAPGHELMEVDFAGIEAVQTGWYQKDPNYIRLATKGVHAYITSHYVGEPASLSWNDSDLVGHFTTIKARFPQEYDLCKHVVHGTNYGLSLEGMTSLWPELFTHDIAEMLQGLYFDLCPKLKAWQDEVRGQAHQKHWLGGPDHPFRYKHWFWDVWHYDKKKRSPKNKEGITRGKDYNRVVAFYPQSTAAGVLYESCLRLMDPSSPYYIGEYSDFKTPIRALIHDSILVEYRVEHREEVLTKIQAAMRMPIVQQPLPPEWGMGSYLTIGVEAKVGKSWGKMSKVTVLESLAQDLPTFEEDEETPIQPATM